MEIDKEELTKQIKQDNLKTGEYVRVEIIVGVNDEEGITPYVETKIKGATPYELGVVCHALEELKKKILEIPHVEKAYKFIELGGTQPL